LLYAEFWRPLDDRERQINDEIKNAMTGVLELHLGTVKMRHVLRYDFGWITLDHGVSAPFSAVVVFDSFLSPPARRQNY
jgi:hypothetical protein